MIAITVSSISTNLLLLLPDKLEGVILADAAPPLDLLRIEIRPTKPPLRYPKFHDKMRG